MSNQKITTTQGYFTVKTLSIASKTPERTIRRYIKDGKIKGHKISNTKTSAILIPILSGKRFIATRK